MPQRRVYSPVWEEIAALLEEFNAKHQVGIDLGGISFKQFVGLCARRGLEAYREDLREISE